MKKKLQIHKHLKIFTSKHTNETSKVQTFLTKRLLSNHKRKNLERKMTSLWICFKQCLGVIYHWTKYIIPYFKNICSINHPVPDELSFRKTYASILYKAVMHHIKSAFEIIQYGSVKIKQLIDPVAINYILFVRQWVSNFLIHTQGSLYCSPMWQSWQN